MNFPLGTIPGTNLPYNDLTHHIDRPIPSVRFPDLTRTPAINTPNLNTVTQTLNLPSSSKDAMIRNILTQMELMQQQLNALIQDNNPKSKEATTTQNESGRNKETRKDKEGESITNIASLEDAQITQKVEQVIQKAKTGLRKEDECILEATSPFISRINKTEIPIKFKLH